MNIKEATREWIREMNGIQQEMIASLMKYDIDSWHEVTKPTIGDRVYCYDYSESGEIAAYNEETEIYTISLDTGKQAQVEETDMEVNRDTWLPMWGTMWSFGDSADDWWLEEDEGIRVMSECGFRIYEHEEFGYFFGIDGCGYDFYEVHWIPLYKKRGLKWHDEEQAENA